MIIAVLNGSPRTGNTAAMINDFAERAREAGHEVEILHVGKMKINVCRSHYRNHPCRAADSLLLYASACHQSPDPS